MRSSLNFFSNKENLLEILEHSLSDSQEVLVNEECNPVSVSSVPKLPLRLPLSSSIPSLIPSSSSLEDV